MLDDAQILLQPAKVQQKKNRNFSTERGLWIFSHFIALQICHWNRTASCPDLRATSHLLQQSYNVSKASVKKIQIVTENWCYLIHNSNSWFKLFHFFNLGVCGHLCYQNNPCSIILFCFVFFNEIRCSGVMFTECLAHTFKWTSMTWVSYCWCWETLNPVCWASWQNSLRVSPRIGANTNAMPLIENRRKRRTLGVSEYSARWS